MPHSILSLLEWNPFNGSSRHNNKSDFGRGARFKGLCFVSRMTSVFRRRHIKHYEMLWGVLSEWHTIWYNVNFLGFPKPLWYLDIADKGFFLWVSGLFSASFSDLFWVSSRHRWCSLSQGQCKMHSLTGSGNPAWINLFCSRDVILKHSGTVAYNALP